MNTTPEGLRERVKELHNRYDLAYEEIAWMIGADSLNFEQWRKGLAFSRNPSNPSYEQRLWRLFEIINALTSLVEDRGKVRWHLFARFPGHYDRPLRGAMPCDLLHVRCDHRKVLGALVERATQMQVSRTG